MFPNFKSENCSWNDVFEQIDTVERAYDAKAPKGSLRSRIRDGKSDAQTLNSLLFVIPDEKGLSILRGGLSFIFQVQLPQDPCSRCQLNIYLGLGATYRESREDTGAVLRHCGDSQNNS